MDDTRAILRREREMSVNPPSNSANTAAAASGASYATNQYPSSAAGGGAPRSAMSKLFPGKPVPMTASLRRPTVMDSDGYARRSEPSLSRTEIARLDAKQTDSSDAYEFLRLRRSMPSASHGRAAEDLAWVHESIKQSEHRSTATSSSSASTVSSGVGIASRSLTPPPDFAGGTVGGGGGPGRPSAYQLQRAYTADVVQRTDGQALGDMSQLRQQVTLLRRSLEEEKKKRALEQKLMQDKIIELQGLIRHNMPEQKRELERNLNAMRTPAVTPTQPQHQHQQSSQSSSVAAVGATRTSQTQQPAAAALPARVRALRNSKHLQQAQERSPYKTMKLLNELRPEQMDLDDGTDEEVGDNDDAEDEVDLEETKERRGNQDEPTATNSSAQSAAVRAVETKMAQELTKLRARMRSVVMEAQNEVKALKQRLEEDHKLYERKERQLRMESSLRVTSLEERHNYAKKKLLAKTSLLSTQVAMLTDENHKLLLDAQCKDDRIRQLELALGGRRIVLESAKQHYNSNPQQQC